MFRSPLRKRHPSHCVIQKMPHKSGINAACRALPEYWFGCLLVIRSVLSYQFKLFLAVVFSPLWIENATILDLYEEMTTCIPLHSWQVLLVPPIYQFAVWFLHYEWNNRAFLQNQICPEILVKKEWVFLTILLNSLFVNWQQILTLFI